MVTRKEVAKLGSPGKQLLNGDGSGGQATIHCHGFIKQASLPIQSSLLLLPSGL